MPRVLPETRCPEVILAIQLEKLLQKHLPGKCWGVNQRIHEATGLSRAKIRALRKNAAKTISIDTLQRIVSYLVSECHVSPAELLGTFFGVQPSGFWTMFTSSTSERFKVQICQGVRNDPNTAEPTWVNACDAYLSATFIRHLVANDGRRQPDLEQVLLRAYSGQQHKKDGQQHKKDVFAESRSFYKGFRRDTGSRALVCIGSMKSLPLGECLLAQVFGATAFKPQTNVQRPGQRAIPVFFRYRGNDPQPPSAFGGREFSLAATNGRAGVAYEIDGEHWGFCPISETEDAGMVYYVYRPTKETVELVLAGFSGRATACIALGLPELASQLWPPLYKQSDLMVGAFILRYEFPPPTAHQSDSRLIPVEPSATEVIPLSGDVLARRLAGVVLAPPSARKSAGGGGATSRQRGKRNLPR